MPIRPPHAPASFVSILTAVVMAHGFAPPAAATSPSASPTAASTKTAAAALTRMPGGGAVIGRAPISVPLGPWMFRAIGGPPGFGDWMPAVVPGSVHTDLLRAGKIPDPFYGTNEKSLQWIEHTDWEYRSTLMVDASLLAHDRVEIAFSGLDTYADVLINGAPFIAADNMFRSWRADMKPRLHPGANVVTVHFHSPIARVKPAYDRLGYTLPAANDQAKEMVSMFSRKAPYHYGWDWGPRFVTSGIWRPVIAEAWDAARLDDVQVYQRSLNDAEARLDVVASVQATRPGRATLAVTLSGGGGPVATVDATLKPGANQIVAPVTIGKPQRWWPNGLGAAHLYGLESSLTVDGNLRGTRARRIGLRTVEVVHQNDKDGKSFTVKVNGAPVFMKGANYIPSDSFLERETPERHRALLQAAADANMNMLRVWGGGVYEDDAFYDLADEMGLLIWQDFMFACSMYPGDAAFLDNVRKEATENVRRLRNHPSIALWAGNNEIEAAWQQWGWQAQFHLNRAAQGTIWRDYKKLFHEILPQVVAANDPGRFYTRSSPSANDDSVSPGKRGWGDSHFWGVWHAEMPYAAYEENTSRFMSEYGFQSFPTLDSVARYVPASEWRIDSPTMLAHQRHPRGNQLVRAYMERDFHVPGDFGAFLYMSQVLQATVIKYAAEAHRRHMPYNMGSLYWQLDDCWPVASWSSIDYYGRWKALQYAARRFFAPILVSPVERKGNIEIFVVSDRRADVPARLTLRVLDFDGRELWHQDRDVTVRALASDVHVTIPRAELLRGVDASRAVLVAELRAAGVPVSRNLFYFAKTRDLALPKPELATNVTSHGSTATVTVVAKRMARAVWLSTAEGDGMFSDNFFDLLPGESVSVEWKPRPGEPARPPTDLSARLRVMSVRDTY